MKIKELFATFLAVIQLFMATFGFVELGQPDIQYGGIPYEEEVISEYLTIVEDGHSDYKIVVPEDASNVEMNAANELKDYFEQISGVVLTIVEDTAQDSDYEICLGDTNRIPEDIAIQNSDLGEEGFSLKAYNEKLFIVGGSQRGTLYGVYTFLEEQLGCRWFTPDLTVIPENSTVRIHKHLDDKQIPCFEYRDVFWISAFDEAWKAKQKINSNFVAPVSEEYGGGISYADFAHSMERLVPVSYADSNPEYFSFREDVGARTLDQRCLTNPDVLEITIENARQTIQNNPNAKIMSITQNDNQNYCQCENCKASDEYYGGPSGTNIWFVNQVAEALEEEFPDIAFDTFAYQYTRSAPKNIEPRDNVIVRLCSIECCFTHPLSECGHTRGESISAKTKDIDSSFASDLEAWSEICDRLYIWDYTTNFHLYLSPFPNFHVLSANMQYFAENNVKGVFEQGNHTGGKSGEFGELRAYILAKLIWNPYADVEYHMIDFMNAYYGENSAAYIKEYIEIFTHKYIKTSHLFIFNRYDEGAYLTKAQRIKCDELWDSAVANAGNEQQLANIQRSQLSYRFYKACLMLDEYTLLSPGRISENEKLYNDIVSHGIKRLTEWHDITEKPIFFLRPVEWKE